MVNIRRVVAMAVITLSSAFIHAQERDNGGFQAEFSVIPRLDGALSVPRGGGSSELSLGNSSLYTLAEGNITDFLSFGFCGHWLSDDPAYLYDNTFHSDATNWLDALYLDFSVGSFDFTLGKDMVTTGGFENEDYDFDVHPFLCSGIWNNFSCYQWGAKAAWTTPSEKSSFAFQFSASPYGERPFSSGLFNYSLSWNGEYGPLSTVWSATAVDTGDGFIPFVMLGQRLEFGSWTVGLDVSNQVGTGLEILSDGLTLIPSLAFSPCDKWEFTAKGVYQKLKDPVMAGEDDSWLAGVSAHWFPLRDSQDLRIHAVAAYDSAFDAINISLGLIFYLRFVS